MKIDKYWILLLISFFVSLSISIGTYFVSYSFFKAQLIQLLKKNAENYVEVSAVSVGSKKNLNNLIQILEKAPYIEKVSVSPIKKESEFSFEKDLVFPDGKVKLFLVLDRYFILQKVKSLAYKVSGLILLLTLTFISLLLISIRKLYLYPLAKIRSDVDKISSGKLSKLPYLGYEDEFYRIRKSINDMIDKIRQKNIREEVISQFIHLLTIGKGFNGEFVSLIKKVLEMTNCDGVIIGVLNSDSKDRVDIRLITLDGDTRIFSKRIEELEGIEPLLLEMNREVETSKLNILSPEEKKLGIRYVFGVPLSVFSDIFGFVIFFRKNEEALSEENKVFLRNIARSIAISVQIKKLIVSLEEKLEKERKLVEGIVKSFIRGIEIRDSYTRGHSERVAFFSKRIAEEMGLSKEEVNSVYIAGLLHDIGKIGIPDSILLKPSKLTSEEFEIIKLHPELGYELLKHIEPLESALSGIRYHHERWNGSGYPKGLNGKSIPLQARILAVADSFDAMTSDRIYRKGMEKREAMKEIVSKAGELYDPDVVNSAIHILLNEEPPSLSDDTFSSEFFRHLEERRLDYYLRDHLTGAFNRNALELAYSIAKERFKSLLAFTVDIERLREININEGWQKGDYLLKKLVELLYAKLKDALIVRYSSDNFLIFTKNVESIESVIKEIEESLRVKINYYVVNRVDDIEELERELTRLEF